MFVVNLELMTPSPSSYCPFRTLSTPFTPPPPPPRCPAEALLSLFLCKRLSAYARTRAGSRTDARGEQARWM